MTNKLILLAVFVMASVVVQSLALDGVRTAVHVERVRVGMCSLLSLTFLAMSEKNTGVPDGCSAVFATVYGLMFIVITRYVKTCAVHK